MTARNLSVRAQAWKAKWTVFQIQGFVCKRFLPSFPSPSPLFYSLHFSHSNYSLLPNSTETLATQATFHSLSFSLSFNSHTKEGATHFLVTRFAADIIGGRRSQGYQHKNQ